MARNKYPEQTIESILNVSTKLFITNGYDKTTIQDIMDELNLSKGAIYYHFKSKEEILNKIIENHSLYARDMLAHLIKTTKAVNTKERIRKILLSIATDRENHEVDLILCSQIKSPQFVVAGIKSCVDDDAVIIGKLLEEGIEDGSLNIENPRECAEVFMLLLNIWCNPILFDMEIEQTRKKLNTLQNIMVMLGADVVSEELIESLLNHYSQVKKFMVG